MQKVFKCEKCGAYTYVSATPLTVYAQPQCDCGSRMKEEGSNPVAVKERSD